MKIIDRYILKRFFGNFLLLFCLLFLFAAGIEVIINLDEYVKSAQARTEEGAGAVRSLAVLLALIVDFEAPRILLLYAYLHGVVAIGAMAFTLAQMHRQKELVALLASGVSLKRLALPFVAAVLLISLVQVANQELLLHRVAPLLLRSHGNAGRQTIEEFPVRFTKDGSRNLFQSPTFHPDTSEFIDVTILERDEAGRTRRRITAARATWDEARRGWQLEDGVAVSLRPPEERNSETSWRESIDFYPTDLDPKTLIMRRRSEYAGMLSLQQIGELIESSRAVDLAMLLRYRYARFAMVFVNLLVLAAALPYFLLREPANLMRQALLCAGLALPTLMGASLGMTMALPGISPALGVFLPVILLVPLAIGRWTFMRT